MSSIANPVEGSAIQEEKPGWHLAVREMPHRNGYSYPVFEWSYGFSGMRGGEVQAWSLHNLLTFHDRRGITLEPGECNGCEVDWENELIKFRPHQSDLLLGLLMKSYAWGEPPHFRKVSADMAKAKERLSQVDADKAKIVLELKQEWDALASEC